MRRPGLSVLFVLLLAAPAAAQKVDAELYFNAGLAHLRDGRPQMAVEEFKKAVKQDGKNPYAYKGLGLANAALRRYDDAIVAFKRALELNPYYVDVRNDLGTALVLSGKRVEGKNEFLTAFNDATNPTPEISARNLGSAYLEEKNYGEALNWYRTSMARNKAYPDAYLGLSDALVALGRTEETVTYLETGVKEVPGHVGLVAALGEAYQRVGRLSDARARLEEARRKDPTGPVGRRAGVLLQQIAR
jgi:tetratricopeptide (TPR) repeat protein